MTAAIARLGGGLPRSYWKLWTASAASNLADGIFWVALPLLAIALTDSPALVAGVTIASRLPWLLFALVAGALADRLDRRRTMVVVDLVRAALMATLALSVVTDLASLPLLYVVALALGVAETLFDTSAQSIMPSLVEGEQLSRANGRLYAVELTMNQFVGPPLGGLLAAYGVAAAFGTEAVAYLLAAGTLFIVPGAFRPVRDGPPTRIHQEIGEGLRFLFGHPVLRTLAVMVGIGNLGSTAVFSVFVLYAVAPGPMGLSEVGYGVLMTSMAIGSLLGSMLTERLERWLGRANLLAVAMGVTAVMTAVPAFTTNAFLVGASFAATGFVLVAWNVVTVSLRQRIVPDRLLGRLNASYRLLAWGTMPIGAVVGGLIGELAGLPAVFIVAALLSGSLLAGRLVVTDAAIAAAEAENAPAEGATAARPETATPPTA